MEYTIENEYLKVTVTTWGAQVKSVIRKCDGVEHMWQADKSVWGYHAPILFPHAGKIVDGIIEAKGGEYARVGQGSIRNIIMQPYQFVCASETENGVYNPHSSLRLACYIFLFNH